jgi:hypothetical protein
MTASLLQRQLEEAIWSDTCQVEERDRGEGGGGGWSKRSGRGGEQEKRRKNVLPITRSEEIESKR